MSFLEKEDAKTKQFCRFFPLIRGLDLLPRFVFLYADDPARGTGLFLTEPDTLKPPIEGTRMPSPLLTTCFSEYNKLRSTLHYVSQDSDWLLPRVCCNLLTTAVYFDI
jgi:hypothetical protein